MTYDWPAALRELNEALFEVIEEDELEFLAARPDPKWLGEPPATDDEIRAAEAALGVRFPAAYTSFLRASNGWYGMVGGFPLGITSLLGVGRVFWMRTDRHRETDRFRDHLAAHPELVDPPARPGEDLLDRVLCIGESDGNECILLIVGASEDDWPIVLWHPEIGFSERPGFTDLFRDELLDD